MIDPTTHLETGDGVVELGFTPVKKTRLRAGTGCPGESRHGVPRSRDQNFRASDLRVSSGRIYPRSGSTITTRR